MISEKVLICGVVKNASLFLQRSLERCMRTGSLFDDYRIVLYENNSTDNTKNILQMYKTHPKYKILTEDIPKEEIKEKSRIWSYIKVTGSDHPCRIEQICNARNKVLDEINKPEYDEFTYVIWIDLDTNYWSLDGIKEVFHTEQEWDVVYANGMECGNVYYDIYAYRDREEHTFGAEMIGVLYSKHNVRHPFKINPHDSSFIPVVSAFGGIGIFKKSIFQTFQYDCILNEDVKQYYRNVLDTEPISDSWKEMINKECDTFVGGKKDETHDIHWKCNSGYDNVVVCEHVCLNLALYNKGYKVFIHPKLIYIHT